MDNSIKKWLWIIPAVVLVAAGFILATRWDLAISVRLYSPHSFIAIFMEAFGWLPSFLPAVLLALLWAAEGCNGEEKRWRFPLGCGIAALFLCVLFTTAYGYLENRGLAAGPMDPRSWGWLAFFLLLAALALRWVLRLDGVARVKYRFFALVGCAYLIGNQAVINLLKILWQRMRFDEMLAMGGFGTFTAWYEPFGHGGTSFPSGHTANACGIFLLLILCDLFPKWNRRRPLVYILCWGYVALMAFSRVMIGRHFISDTIAAALIMALLFFFLHHTKLYKKSLLLARAAGKSAPASEAAGNEEDWDAV